MEVIDATPGPDGDPRHYYLRVPPTVRTAREAVLQAGRHPQICYRGRWAGSGLSGELELRGRRSRLQVPAEVRDGRLIGEVELRPSLWGIEPYTAMLGALRVQDRVRLRFDLAHPG